MCGILFSEIWALECVVCEMLIGKSPCDIQGGNFGYKEPFVSDLDECELPKIMSLSLVYFFGFTYCGLGG